MWEQIRSNRTRSIILVALMGAFLVGIGWLLGVGIADSGTGGVVVAILLFIILSLLAYFQGDSILLSVAGARKIKREDHPRLYNVVEEMKIAASLPTIPDIYIIDDPSLNAFATGRDINHASVAITSGLLEKLNRDELQGVIAHEIGHIKNRDVLLMAMCSVLLGTIVILSFYGSRLMIFGGMSGGSRRSGSRDNRGGGGAAIIVVIALLLAILAPIFAQLIYLAVSRRREYLADASSALYTRNPEGLASALEKLAASTAPVKNANQATAPMYIVNPFRNRNASPTDWTSTHPPIQERIRILRAMAGNVSYTTYNEAYKNVKHSSGGVMSSQSAALVPGAAIVAGTQQGPVEEPAAAKVDRAREVSNLMYKLDDYSIIDCECGTRLKVPPALRGQTVRCPHCGRRHQA